MRNTRASQLLFELSRPGRRAAVLPPCDVPVEAIEELIPAEHRAAAPPPLPEVAEIDLVRHYVNLSTLNMSVDSHFYPLGSCTMKYNSKRNERLVALSGMADLHPYQREEALQGMLELLYEMQRFLAEISGLPAVSLQPAAGAHGEMTALFVDDCEVSYAPNFGAKGKAAYAETLGGIGPYFAATTHHVSNVCVDFFSKTEAHVRSVVLALHRYRKERPDGWLFGQYHDIVVKVEGRWKFKRRELRTTMTTDYHVKTFNPIGRAE